MDGRLERLSGLRANETRSNWTRSIFSVPMRRVSVGRVPMRRVPNRRGYIVMADTFTWFIKYCCIIDDMRVFSSKSYLMFYIKKHYFEVISSCLDSETY